ncbi:hypothetical protein CC86DRAFT_464968 [Ophiobolus disseminans]|uniref:Uncharacterized protein n=1 Tax=Ophiobolus disseminans TaxID=1469910 RepID=A0A6A7A947_9PLEO|nr:hypothetical protein CC86DRAFT_464968 [Ophiobolus disseminans]
MAEQVTKDVVKEAQSVGRLAPIDDTASTTNTPAANGELPSGPATANPTLSDPSSIAASANGADAAPAGSARVSGKADGAAIEAMVDNDRALLNGDSSENAIADASGGSDTDISRPSSVDQSKRDANHVRTTSMKKPSAFKSVSVTKNFLAKSVVSTPPVRPGEKAAPVAPSASSAVLTAKPRLVAKLGTGNAPRMLGKVNGAGAGPDASKVWNKNQPVPPAPPKQFTDEELKQQYGIHLATRLQADEAGKEAKWADIDDDEDDWAPETVQWMDGTKSSGAAGENEPPPVEEPKIIAKAPETAVETPKPAPVAAPSNPKTTVSGGTKTILKPGAHTQPATAATTATGKSSLVLKGQPEKPTLVSKPSASEKKSPWATLPPVEKVSPIHVNPPAQQPQQRFSQRESYGYDPMPSLPAKEIAPDDFNRSWRDDSRTRPELFNSQSGRYEPVNDMRRGSTRDSGFRQQPSVLQRPSQDGPAEPSAAFQQSRSGGDAPMWGGGRRRNSSNVSGGNPRRMSFDRRPPDMPTGPIGFERRGSHAINGVDSSSSAVSRQPSIAQAISPNVTHAHPASPYSVASSGAHDLPTPVSAPSAPPAPPAEDPVEAQKRLMADKIERARLKKQQEREAEEKEEAERKERLAKRLAAMGPPKAKEPLPAHAPQQSPKKDHAAPAAAHSPPKPPVPTTDGEIAQYGMMKVHHAQPVKKASPVEGSKAVTADPTISPSTAKAQTENQTRPQPPLAPQPAKPLDAFTRENEKSRQPGEQLKGASQSENPVPAGPRSQATQASWQPNSAPQPRPWTSQVWGPPPTKERALGNGTFGSAYDRNQPRTVQPQQPSQPQPTPTATVNLNIAPKLSSSQPPNTTPAQSLPPQSGPMVAQIVLPQRPGPIAPPQAHAWHNFKALIDQDDKDMAAKGRQDREGMGGDALRPEIRETYKNQRGQSHTTMYEQVGGNRGLPNGAVKDDAVKLPHEAPSPQHTLGQGTPLQQATGPRASRFFPRSTESTSQPAVTASSKADSPPPPPETESHPAFASGAGHPLVRLPKPSPVVRLPRPAAGGPVQADAPVTMPPRGNPGLGARPLTMNPEWQARFNKLLEKPGTSHAQAEQAASSKTTNVATPVAPANPKSLPIAASSKAALEVRGNTGSATVSLPNAPVKRNFAYDRGADVITRKGTEVLFEDREFGSLPTVKLSKASHLAANEPAVAAPNDDSALIRFKKIENPFTQRRLEAFDHERTAQKIDVVIRIDTMREAIIKSMPRGRRAIRNSGPYSKPKRNSNAPNGSSTGGSKDRPRKPSGQSQTDRPSNTTRPSNSNSWSNSSRPTTGSGTGHQAATWARRAAAPVH